MSKLGIYVGSFDPFHIGHLEVVTVALNFVDKVIIVPNNPNKRKPHRADLHHRIHMIELSVKNNNRIIVSAGNITEINQSLYDKYHLVGIIGSDQCLKEPKTKVHEWLIANRQESPENNLSLSKSNYNREDEVFSWTVPTKYLPMEMFHDQHWSSTYIRNNILFNNISQLPLCDEVLDYIKSEHLYTFESKAKQLLWDHMNVETIKHIHKIQTNLIIIDDNIVIKAFQNYDTFNYERTAFIKAKELDLPIPKYLFDQGASVPPNKIASNSNDMFIGMSYTGKSIKDNIIDGVDPYIIGENTGKLLRHLHNIEKYAASANDIRNNRKLRNIIESQILIKYLGVDLTNELINNYVSNPGYFGYCHGDASINNFTVMIDTLDIVMIDFSGIAKMGNFGIPAYEYYQFLTSIESSLSNQDKTKRYKIKQGFINGYGPTGFTVETNKLFQTVWYLIYSYSNKI